MIKITELVVNEYKELGELKTKHVGGSTNTALQKVDYKYNIRGWLTDIIPAHAGLVATVSF